MHIIHFKPIDTDILFLLAMFLHGFLGGSVSKESACNMGDLGSIPGFQDPLEEGMATHSRFLPGESPWTEESGGLHSIGRRESDMTEQLSITCFFSQAPTVLPWWLSDKETCLQCKRCRRHIFDPWTRKTPRRRE